MIGLEALQSVQYVTVKEKRLAIIGIDEWETMIEWLETLEDAQIARQCAPTGEAGSRSTGQRPTPCALTSNSTSTIAISILAA